MAGSTAAGISTGSLIIPHPIQWSPWVAIAESTMWILRRNAHVKCINGVAPIRLINVIKVNVIADIHSYPTRAFQYGDVHMPMSNIELYPQSFKYRAAVLWNDLTQDIKLNAPNIEHLRIWFVRCINHVVKQLCRVCHPV